jgi:hypothetical protein
MGVEKNHLITQKSSRPFKGSKNIIKVEQERNQVAEEACKILPKPNSSLYTQAGTQASQTPAPITPQ